MIQLQIIRVATELFELANQEETKTEAQSMQLLIRRPAKFCRDTQISQGT